MLFFYVYIVTYHPIAGKQSTSVSLNTNRHLHSNTTIGESPPLEAVTRGLVKRQQTKKTQCLF
jgi:hypothetical protein